MVQVGPVSPPPSNTGELLQNGFQHLIQHNASTSYPRDTFDYNEGDQLHYRTQPSYESPARTYRSIGYHFSAQQSPYSYPNQYQDNGLAMHYEGLSPGSSQYGAMPTDHRFSQYNTPAGSPPPSSMSTPASDAIRTRSGLIIDRSSQSQKPLPHSMNRPSSSPKIKKVKKERGKAEKVAKLDKSLSELTKDWDHVPVVNIEEYVNRSAEVRRKEVEDGKIPGRVKRPMNSFMLYRKAYQNRCKHWCLQNNHQVVSQVCGDSWPLESNSVREQFNEWARIERVNHQNAHPGYKFSPSKSGNNKGGGKRKVPEDIISEESGLDDYDWEREQGKNKKSSNHRSRVSENTSYASTRSPYEFSRDVSEEPSYNSYNRSSYQISNPGKRAPVQYNHFNLDNGQYYQQTTRQHTAIPGVEDVVIKKTAMPGMHYLGLPGGHDLMNTYHLQEGTMNPEYRIDPLLMDHDPPMYDNKFDSHEGVYGDSLGNNQHWQEQYGVGEPFDYLNASHPLDHLQIHDQHLQIFKGNHEDWQVETLDAGQEFDKWMDDNKEIAH